MEKNQDFKEILFKRLNEVSCQHFLLLFSNSSYIGFKC